MKFMNLEEEGEFVILTIPFEGKASYKKGASKGPREIIKASTQLEYYDEEFNNEPARQGIKTINLKGLKNEQLMLEKVSKAVKNNKFLVALGGDHSTSIGLLKGLRTPFSVLQLDAHPDLFYTWKNSEYNHRCFGHKAQAKAESLVQVGIRAMDKDEKNLISTNNKILSVSVRALRKKKKLMMQKILNKLSTNVLISIDADVFDPSIISRTGTPEPGGLYWQEVINLLKEVFKHKNVILTDINEFRGGSEVEAYTLAKLTYKILSMKSATIKD